MEKNIIRNLRKNLRKLERLVFLQQSQCCKTVTNAQCHVLLEIEELGKTTTQELSDKLSLDKSTLSRTVDSLVKMELVERLNNPNDRRYTPLSLTLRGKNTCYSINQENDELYERLFGHLKPEEFNVMVSNFEQMVQLFFNNKSPSCKSGQCDGKRKD